VTRLAVPILLVFVAAATACALGRPPEAPADQAKTSLQLIAEGVEQGKIDQDTATLYRVYAVTDESKLPAQYRGSAPIRDGTTVLREARSQYDQLRPETQKALKPYLFPRGEP
jgi:hypothetical protein